MTDLDSVFISTVEAAVSASVAQNKPLIVFNTDSSDESNRWVESLMSDDILQLISEKAIALKLVKNSAQFALFEQIFPEVIIPSFYCIKVSAILDIIHGALDNTEFESRIKKVLVTNPQGQHPQPSSSSHPPQTGSQQSDTPQVSSQSQASTPTLPRDTSQIPSASGNLSGSSSVRGSSQASSRANTPGSQINGKRERKTLKEEVAELSAKKYKEEQLRKKKVEKEERERVKRLLEADKEERRLDEKLRKEERERQRRLSNDEEVKDDVKIDDIINENQTLKNNVRDRRPSTSLVCALLIRLLDGSSLRHEFKNTDTLNDVRKWIDENRTDSDDPYCFHRTIPRVTFGVTDEEKTLESLELTPRSALILKPFNTYANAYSNSGKTTQRAPNGGLLSRVFGGLSSLWYGNQGNRRLNANEENRDNDTIEEDDDLIDPVSPISSSYASPAQTPRNFNEPEANTLDLLHPSALNLNLNMDQIQRPTSPQVSAHTQEHGSRIGTPLSLSRMNSSQSRIRTLNSSENDDRMTYNGNHINLEDDPKKN